MAGEQGEEGNMVKVILVTVFAFGRRCFNFSVILVLGKKEKGSLSDGNRVGGEYVVAFSGIPKKLFPPLRTEPLFTEKLACSAVFGKLFPHYLAGLGL
jgi:hypothetical protein